MDKDDVKKIDGLTAEEAAETQETADELVSGELENVDGGRVHFNPNSPVYQKDRAKATETGASGSW